MCTTRATWCTGPHGLGAEALKHGYDLGLQRSSTTGPSIARAFLGAWIAEASGETSLLWRAGWKKFRGGLEHRDSGAGKLGLMTPLLGSRAVEGDEAPDSLLAYASTARTLFSDVGAELAPPPGPTQGRPLR